MPQPWIFNDANWLWNESAPMGKDILNFRLANGTLSNTVQVCPGTIYWAVFKFTNIRGSGQLGLDWTGGGNKPMSKAPETTFDQSHPELKVEFVAPMDARYATVWMYTAGGSTADIQLAWFGPQDGGDLSVYCKQVLRDNQPLTKQAVGVNVNYLTDHKGRREGTSKNPSFTDALKKMNVGSLRYPGGEKSDTYFYAPGPNFWPAKGQSQPTLSRQSTEDFPAQDEMFYILRPARWVNPPMTFDEFMDICSTPGIDAEPYIVIGWDAVNKPITDLSGKYASEDDVQKHALNWAKYCALHYPGVTRWEFGNECYLSTQEAGATAEKYAKNLWWYATELKKANSKLKIGANGPNNMTEMGKFDQKLKNGVTWWPKVLGTCAGLIDFLCIHPYVILDWDWDDYAAGAVNLVSPIQEANASLDMYASQQRIDISITEVAPIDYKKVGNDFIPKWPWWPATLGHALVTIDQMASTLMQRRVDSAMFWNTRWITSSKKDQMCKDASVADAIHNDYNGLTACGGAVSFVGAFFRDGWPVFSTSSRTVKLFALKTDSGLRVVLLNKSRAPVRQTVNISEFRSSPTPLPENKDMYVFTGSDISDRNPTWVTPSPPATWFVQFGSGPDKADQLIIDLLPYSATAVNLVPNPTPPKTEE